MVAKFWVGGTGTWDTSSDHWSTVDGSTASGTVAPTTADTVTFSSQSGGGTVTVNTTVDVVSIAMGTFTGTLDFSANNNNVTVQTFSGTGAGVRTFNMGNGTWNVTATTGTVWDFTTTTNLTFNSNGSTVLLAVTPTGTRVFTCGSGLVYNAITLNDATRTRFHTQFGNGRATTFSIGGNTACVDVATGNTFGVTNAFSWSGTPSSPIQLCGGSFTLSGTLSSCASMLFNWASFFGLTKAGGGTITANNSFDMGGNSGITINPPNVGGAIVGG